jgi:homoserine dehydrogenase
LGRNAVLTVGKCRTEFRCLQPAGSVPVVDSRATPVRVCVIGTGTVGRWLLRAIARDRERLAALYGVDLSVVAVGGRDGMVGDPAGIDMEELLALRSRGGRLAELDGHRPSVLEGIAELDADVLAEVSQSPPADGEPGLSHIRAALERGISVATSNKWPVALAGVELAERARRNGIGFRAESTVMSGTPVLAALTDGLGGATPLRLRGVVNATVNVICSRMEQGAGYAEALADAQAAGLAERDPSADVDGLDSVAKLMVLSALVFGEQLEMRDVTRRGLSELAASGLGPGAQVREVATLDPAAGRRSVEATVLADGDPLAAIVGATNCIRLEAEPLGEVSITGPGAGPALAGQGVFSDVIALARQRASALAVRPSRRRPSRSR